MPLVEVTACGWWALELGLVVRDRARGMGGTGRDQGTRILIFVVILVAVVMAATVASILAPHTWLRFARGHPAHGHIWLDLAVLWTGLVVRLWAIAALGRSFRTTVEVDAGQAVVDRGPYHRIRHPAYTGALLLCLGIGLALGDWISLAIMMGLPLCALLRRIAVEERELVHVLGEPYRVYQARTKRLIPFLW